MQRVMHRLLLTALACACLVTPALAAAGADSTASASWARPEIRTVVARGLMAPDLRSFRPDDALTRGELADVEGGITGRPVKAPTRPDAAVTIAELDRKLVGLLGLRASAAAL